MKGLERLIGPAPYDFWLVDLTALEGLSECACLSDTERARADRFVFGRDRRRYEAAHCALRRILSEKTGCPAGQLRLAEGPFGKPHLIGHPSVAFNLSHSEDVAMVVLACEGDLGVDIECLRSIPDARELAERNFAPAEIASLHALPYGQRDLAFLRGWTRKEACVKAIGAGLSIDPCTFDAGVGQEPRMLAISWQARTWRVEVQSVDAGPDRVAAVARILI